MPSTINTVSESRRLARKLREISTILTANARFLDKHSYDKVAGGDYENHERYTYVGYYVAGSSITFHVNGPESKALMSELRRRMPARKWNKAPYGDTFAIQTPYSPDHARISIEGPRDVVCTRVVTGTETVTIPAVEAKPERTEEREVVEWDCGTLLEDGEA